MFRTGKRTMVGRIRDFHGRVINPKDHFVLPNKQKLSRSDVRDILSDPSVWRGNIQSLIPQFLDYMVSPWKGAPTVAKKVRGGAPGLEAFAGNPALASRLTDHYARRTTPTTFVPSAVGTNTVRDLTTKRKSDSDPRGNEKKTITRAIYHQPSTFPNPFVRATVKKKTKKVSFAAPLATGYPYPPSNDPFAAEPPPRRSGQRVAVCLGRRKRQ